MAKRASKEHKTTDAYELTDQERLAIKRVAARRKQQAPSPRFKIEVQPNGHILVRSNHESEAVAQLVQADTFATGNFHLSSGLLLQCADAARTGKQVREKELDFMVALVRGIAPRDETEALLATQMAAIHNATIVAARRLNHVETIEQQDSASSMLNKLARTFTLQIEALKKYRSAGEQTIKVQHVTVNDGGQAIVGNVTQGGGDGGKSEGQPHEATERSSVSPALLGHEQTLPSGVPVARSQRLDRVPLSRRQRRGAQGKA